MQYTKYRYQRSKIATRSNKPPTKKRVVIISLGLLILVGILGHAIFRTFERRYRVEREKQEFLAEINQIEQESAELAKLKELFATQEYQEKEAKERLDLQNPGEQAIVVPSSETSTKPSTETEELVSILKEPKSEERLKASTNPEKWWAFFFDKQRLR